MSQPGNTRSASAVALAEEALERDMSPAEVESLRPFQKLIYELRQEVPLDGGNDAFEIAAMIVDEIYEADSIEAIFEANEKGPEDSDDLLENALGVYAVTFWRSAEKFRRGTLGYYVVIRFVDGNKNERMVSVGATNVVASMFAFRRLGAFNGGMDKPFWIKIHGRDTGNGTLYIVQRAEAIPF